MIDGRGRADAGHRGPPAHQGPTTITSRLPRRPLRRIPWSPSGNQSRNRPARPVGQSARGRVRPGPRRNAGFLPERHRCAALPVRSRPVLRPNVSGEQVARPNIPPNWSDYDCLTSVLWFEPPGCSRVRAARSASKSIRGSTRTTAAYCAKRRCAASASPSLPRFLADEHIRNGRLIPVLPGLPAAGVLAEGAGARMKMNKPAVRELVAYPQDADARRRGTPISRLPERMFVKTRRLIALRSRCSAVACGALTSPRWCPRGHEKSLSAATSNPGHRARRCAARSGRRSDFPTRTCRSRRSPS